MFLNAENGTRQKMNMRKPANRNLCAETARSAGSAGLVLRIISQLTAETEHLHG